ncbi:MULTISPECIES: hypothetical protein [Edwardsiella]|uniref:hypothetical protein n=1 Tax=Edwardsiella TaxID=635 RepID=UPI00045CD098|nr:hypothetical protein [Edwardsiella anguillarum]GAJ69161.1 hypothetical protein MA13_contig00020-0032 [Edwardsiella piscicida]
MAISHDIGFFFPFKVNRPLTKEEKQSRFVQGKRRKVFGEAAVLDLDTVIRISSSFLEVTDKFYPVKEVIAGPMMCMLLFIIGLSSWFYWEAMYSPDYKGGVLGCFMILIALSFFCFLCGKPLLKDWFQKTHYPVRFNRKKTTGAYLPSEW